MSQSQKSLVQLLVLLGLAGGIGGYAYFGVLKKDATKKQQADHDLRLFAPQKLDERQPDGGSAEAEFTHLRLTSQGVTTVLKREGKAWWVVEPVRARADKLVLDAIISQLQSQKFKATLEEDPDAATLEKYGLTKPGFVVEATAQVNGQTRSVKLVGGIENPFDGSVYVRRNDEKPVFTAEGGVRFTMSKSTFELRSRTPFSVDEPSIVKIETRSRQNHYVVQRGADRLWTFLDPAGEPADTSGMSAMISAAAGEHAQSFPDDTPAARKALGFEAPVVDTTLSLVDGGTVRLRVAGGENDGGSPWYGLREDGTEVVLAEVSSNATQYDRNPIDLRDKTIVRFQRELVTKIVFRDVNGPEVVVARDSVDASAEAWRVVAPRVGKAKIFKVTSALWTLGNAKALAAGEEHPKDWARYGLGPGAKSITFFGADGTELGRFVIGKEVPQTPSGFFVRGTRDQVLQSDGSRFGEFPFTLADVLDEPSDAGADGGPTSP